MHRLDLLVGTALHAFPAAGQVVEVAAVLGRRESSYIAFTVAQWVDCPTCRHMAVACMQARNLGRAREALEEQLSGSKQFVSVYHSNTELVRAVVQPVQGAESASPHLPSEAWREPMPPS